MNESPLVMRGEVFGRLTVVSENSTGGKASCECLCQCGKSLRIRVRVLQRGGVKSCGCSRYMRRPVEDRFWEKVNKQGSISQHAPHLGSCWEWTGAKSHGYGRFGLERGVSVASHRLAYRLLIGPVSDDLELDHLCRNPSCVNPLHLEPVTSRENTVVRGVGLAAQRYRQTHCLRGHPLSGSNLRRKPNGNRICAECARMRDRRKVRKRKNKKVNG